MKQESLTTIGSTPVTSRPPRQTLRPHPSWPLAPAPPTLTPPHESHGLTHAAEEEGLHSTDVSMEDALLEEAMLTRSQSPNFDFVGGEKVFSSSSYRMCFTEVPT